MRTIYFFGSLLVVCFAVIFVYILGIIIGGLALLATFSIFDLLEELF